MVKVCVCSSAMVSLLAGTVSQCDTVTLMALDWQCLPLIRQQTRRDLSTVRSVIQWQPRECLRIYRSNHLLAGPAWPVCRLARKMISIHPEFLCPTQRPLLINCGYSNAHGALHSEITFLAVRQKTRQGFHCLFLLVCNANFAILTAFLICRILPLLFPWLISNSAANLKSSACGPLFWSGPALAALSKLSSVPCISSTPRAPWQRHNAISLLPPRELPTASLQAPSGKLDCTAAKAPTVPTFGFWCGCQVRARGNFLVSLRLNAVI